MNGTGTSDIAQDIDNKICLSRHHNKSLATLNDNFKKKRRKIKDKLKCDKQIGCPGPNLRVDVGGTKKTFSFVFIYSNNPFY